MALVEKRVCDVYGTTIDVTLFRISVDPIDEATGADIEIDLCPRAVKRLEHFIARGVSPPAPRKKAVENPA